MTIGHIINVVVVYLTNTSYIRPQYLDYWFRLFSDY